MAAKLEDLTPEQLALYNATPDILDTDFSNGRQPIDPILSGPQRAAALAVTVTARRECWPGRAEVKAPSVGVND